MKCRIFGKVRKGSPKLGFGLIIIILAIMFILPSVNVGYDVPESIKTTSDIIGHPLNDPNIIPGTRQGGEIWTVSNQINESIEFPKGSDSFIKISTGFNKTERLTLKPEIEPTKFLTKKALEAIDQVPDWLTKDLTNKFVELGAIPFTLGENANSAFDDMDNDGDLDLVCCTPSDGLTYYENCGTTLEPMYVRDGSIFKNIDIVGETIREPTIGDINNDGYLDVAVGSEQGRFYFLINDGKADAPKFQTVSSFDSTTLAYTSPYLVDLNFDGIVDILTGADDGRIYQINNDDTNPGSGWAVITQPFTGIDVGDRSSPTMVDLDDDGDLDLTIGENQANLNFYRNTGTAQNPFWLLDTTLYLGITLGTQTAPELVDLNGDQRYDLITGCGNGRYYYYENIGSASEPQWQIWSSYKVFPGIEYYDPISYLKYVNQSAVDEYAQLILDAGNNLKDEIAFSIAHTSSQVLRDPNTIPEIYKKNAELIYEIDKHISYSDVKDIGSYSSRDYYSTVRYSYKAQNSSIIQSTELPRDIYYWYIVHPKITDEIPAYINPETGNYAPPPVGRFWREYLFYYNDTSYPADPLTDINDDGIPDFHYPKNETPPLLKDKLTGIKYVYDSEPYNAPRGYGNDGYNNTRPWGYKDHAIETISNWVAKTLPLNEQESADGERPIQPVRIMRTHNGNCGELQDLTIAATRTALIPAAGILLLAEDHVWNEFYDRGWHQWDNYWSDGGAVIDNFMNYWKGWGQRGGSGLTKWHGDDSVSDVTPNYVPEEDLSTLTMVVVDRNGYPVDGARVMVGSHWLTEQASGYQVSVPYPSIWNYTDTNGSCTFKVATQENLPEANKNFSFKVISKLGNAEQVKTQLEHGQDYEFRFVLDGRKSEQRISYVTPTPMDDIDYRFMIMFMYEEESAWQTPPNPMVGNYHPQSVTLGSNILFYLMNQTNFHNYQQGDYKSGSPIECIRVDPSGNGYHGYILLDNTDWYLVGYNRNSIETLKQGQLQLYLFEAVDEMPVLTIEKPQPVYGSVHEVGDEVEIAGRATDDKGIEKLTITIEKEDIDITDSLKDGNWSYIWNTEGNSPGNYSILVFAEDTIGNGVGLYVKLTLEAKPPPPPPDETPPIIEIKSPLNGSMYYIGEEISFNGFAKDENESGLSTLTITINSKTIDLLPTLNIDSWSYSWDSDGQDSGEYKFNIRAIDAAGNIARAFGYFELIEVYLDKTAPELTIQQPMPGGTFDQGEQVLIMGTVEDDVGVDELEISIDYAPFKDITKSIIGNTWTYRWETIAINAEVGEHVIQVRAADEVGNEDEVMIIISLSDVTPPKITFESTSGLYEIKKGSEVELEGLVEDNFGVDSVVLTISGQGITEEIRRGIKVTDSDWSYDWSVPSELPKGEYRLTITATDYFGNTDDDTINVNLIDANSSKKDKSDFFMPGFELWALLLCVIILLFVNRRKAYFGNK